MDERDGQHPGRSSCCVRAHTRVPSPPPPALFVFEILRGEGESWHIRHSPLLTPRTLLEQIDGVQIDFLCRSSIFFPLAAPDVPSSPRCTRSGVPSSSSSFLFNQIRSLEEDGENSHFFPSRHLGRSYNHLGIGTTLNRARVRHITGAIESKRPAPGFGTVKSIPVNHGRERLSYSTEVLP